MLLSKRKTPKSTKLVPELHCKEIEYSTSRTVIPNTTGRRVQSPNGRRKPGFRVFLVVTRGLYQVLPCLRDIRGGTNCVNHACCDIWNAFHPVCFVFTGGALTTPLRLFNFVCFSICLYIPRPYSGCFIREGFHFASRSVLG